MALSKKQISLIDELNLKQLNLKDYIKSLYSNAFLEETYVKRSLTALETSFMYLTRGVSLEENIKND